MSNSFFNSGPFMPHGGCYLWTQSLIALHAISDAAITLAYYSIPFTLLYFVRKRKDLKFHWMFVCFAAFVLACGTTHLMEIWNIWHANYWLSGCIKAITALVSLPTAIWLVKLVPHALALPSADALQKARDELEIRVRERTAELERTAQSLQTEIIERKQAEEQIRQQNQELAAISQIITATVTNLDFQTVLDRALRGALEFTQLEGGTLCLADHATQTLNLAAEINTSPAIVQDLTTNLVKIGDCLCGTCAKTCQPLVLWDNASGSQFATREATRNEGLRFHAAFPLCVKDRCIGVLCLFAKSAAKPTERILALVRDLCGPIALAVENARLFKAAQQELTERVQAETALRESEERFRQLNHAAFEGIFVSENGRISDVNDQGAGMFGYQREELIGKAILDFVTTESRQIVTEALRTGREARYEFQALRKDGTQFYAEVQAKMVLAEGR
ncbi:MAG: GAF domain-containing protein [Limisphaerales bacterium]